MLAPAVKAAKRAGADRVEIDPPNGRIVIPLTGNGAEGERDTDGENPWDVVLSRSMASSWPQAIAETHTIRQMPSEPEVLTPIAVPVRSCPFRSRPGLDERPASTDAGRMRELTAQGMAASRALVVEYCATNRVPEGFDASANPVAFSDRRSAAWRNPGGICAIADQLSMVREVQIDRCNLLLFHKLSAVHDVAVRHWRVLL